MPQFDKSQTFFSLETTMASILFSLKKRWKVLIVFTVIGNLIATAYLMIATPKYEARAMIEMAQTQSINSIDRKATISIETPQLLIERLKFPTTYTLEVANACGMTKTSSTDMRLTKMVKTTIPSSVEGVAYISILRPNPKEAKQCINALYVMIARHQQELLATNESEIRIMIAQLKAKIRNTQSFIKDSNYVSLSQTAYLVRRDQMLYLTEKINNLENILLLDEKTKLLAPLYVSEEIVSSSTWQTYLLGTIAGFLCFLAVAFKAKTPE